MVGMVKQHFVQASPIKDFAAFRAFREVLFVLGRQLFVSSAAVISDIELVPRGHSAADSPTAALICHRCITHLRPTDDYG
jgi:hypothetical protein